MATELDTTTAQKISGLNEGTRMLSIELIDPNPNQPRKNFEGLDELAASIKENGLIQPIAVRPIGGRYQIVTGERRYRAVRLAGLNEVAAQIVDVSDQTAYELGLIENIQRQSLTPIEEAESFSYLQQQDWTQERISKLIGKSQQFVASRLSLLRLPDVVQDMITTRVVNASTAQRLVSLGDAKEQIKLAKRAVSDGLNTRDIEGAVWRVNAKRNEDSNTMELFEMMVKEAPELSRYREAVIKKELSIHKVGTGIFGSMEAVSPAHGVNAFKNERGELQPREGQGLVLNIDKELLTKTFTGQNFFWPRFSGAVDKRVDIDYNKMTEDLSIPLFDEYEWDEWEITCEKDDLDELDFNGHEHFFFNVKDDIKDEPLSRRDYDPLYGRCITDKYDSCSVCPGDKIFIRQGWGAWWIVEFNDGEGHRTKRRFFKYDHYGSTLIKEAINTVDPFSFSEHNFRKLEFFKAQKAEMSWFYIRRKTVPREEMITAMEADLEQLKNQPELTEEQLGERALDWLQDYSPLSDGFREGEITFPRSPDGNIDQVKWKEYFDACK